MSSRPEEGIHQRKGVGRSEKQSQTSSSSAPSIQPRPQPKKFDHSSNVRLYVFQGLLLLLALLALFAAGFGAHLIYNSIYTKPPTISRQTVSPPPPPKVNRLIDPSEIDLSQYPASSDHTSFDDAETANYTITNLQDGMYNISCSRPTRKLFEGCSVYKGTNCARVVIDDFLDETETSALVRLAEAAFRASTAVGDAVKGPVNIFDFASGAASSAKGFINVYSVMKTLPFEDRFEMNDVQIYKSVVERFMFVTEMIFGVDGMKLTKPSFISRLVSNVPAQTPHDEYWHSHVDALQYGSFEHTAIIYLNEKDGNYLGGELQFLDKASSQIHQVEPRLGRAVVFTSASENTHRVQKVESLSDGTQGKRYAWIFATTCDPTAAQSTIIPQGLMDSVGTLD